MRHYVDENIWYVSIFVVLLISCIALSGNIVAEDSNDLEWSVTLLFTESGGKSDNVIFGEAYNASDGLDIYDAPDLGGPPGGDYINSYFTTSFPDVHSKLMQEIKQYSYINTYKVWNLSVDWKVDGSDYGTNVTISWDIGELRDSNYDSVVLMRKGQLNSTWYNVVDMLAENSFSYDHEHTTYGSTVIWFLEDDFQIICERNRAPNTPSDPSPVNGTTGVDINAALSWTGGDLDTGDIVTYDIYFGTKSPPPKIITKQSSTSFTPSLRGETTYYWRIIAWDNHGAFSTGPVWSFTTASSSPGPGPGPDPSPPEPNIAPTANASASETVKLVDSILTFDGSQSFDQDGYIKDWSWDFGDGAQGNGEIVTHAYSDSGIYTVILTVADNEDVKDNDSITVAIDTANNPPSNPIVSGEISGNKNVEYQFTATSTDLDNDSISYTFDWGDDTTSTSEFLPNGTAYAINHSWTSAGKYAIGVTTTDNQTTSEQSKIIILIDAHYVGNIGYVIDIDDDGIFDVFRNDTTAIETVVKHQYDGTYLIDINGNGNWDYIYNLTAGITTPFIKKTIDEIPWTVIAVISVALAIISLIVYSYKKDYF